MNQPPAAVSSDRCLSSTQGISKLMALWYRTISLEHHKDRDCHFTIETRFSYGGQVRYLLSHHGYLEKEIEEEFWSYELAEQALIQLLDHLIRKHCQGHAAADHGLEDARVDKQIEVLEELKELCLKCTASSVMP